MSIDNNFQTLRNQCEQKTKDKVQIELAYRLDQLTNPDRWLQSNQWYYEPKYDGVRCVLIDGCPTSRYGNTLNFPPLFNVRLPDEYSNMCLDGELFHRSPYETVAVKRYKTELPDLSQFKFYVFDLVPIDTVLPPHKTYSVPYYERRKHLEQVLKALFKQRPSLKNVIKLVPYKLLPEERSNTNEVYEVAKQYIEQGYEGIVLKIIDSPYKPKRTRDWLKVKSVVDIDADIIDFIKGTGKYSNSLGALVLKPRQGQPVKEIFKVGTGFTDAQRQFIWDHREKLKGLPVTVMVQGVTDKGKARLPVFKYFRLDLVPDAKKRLGEDLIQQMCQLNLVRPDYCALIKRA